jgi:hypothetical protein
MKRNRLRGIGRRLGVSPDNKGHNITVLRLLHIEKHTRYMQAGDTDDYDRWLIAWCWCNPGHDIEHLIEASRRMGRKISRDEAEAVMDEAEASEPKRSAAAVGRWLGVTDEIRERLKLWTIHPIDVGREQMKARRERRKRESKERRRRERGAILRADYEARSLSKAKPWEAEGISRRTWYRRQQQTVAPPLAPAAPEYTYSGSGSPRRYKIAADAMRAWTGTGSPGRYKLATQSGGTSVHPVFFLERLSPHLCHEPAERH